MCSHCFCAKNKSGITPAQVKCQLKIEWGSMQHKAGARVLQSLAELMHQGTLPQSATLECLSKTPTYCCYLVAANMLVVYEGEAR